jgi:hypothetical protein
MVENYTVRVNHPNDQKTKKINLKCQKITLISDFRKNIEYSIIEIKFLTLHKKKN